MVIGESESVQKTPIHAEISGEQASVAESGGTDSYSEFQNDEQQPQGVPAGENVTSSKRTGAGLCTQAGLDTSAKSLQMIST